MTRARLRKVLHPLLALTLLGALTTGVMMVRAEEGGQNLLEFHHWFVLFFVILVVVHVWNNWPMLKAGYTRKPKRNQPGE